VTNPRRFDGQDQRQWELAVNGNANSPPPGTPWPSAGWTRPALSLLLEAVGITPDVGRRDWPSAVDGQVIDLVDEQQPRDGVEPEPVLEAAFGQGRGQAGDEGGGLGEEYAIAALDSLEAEPHPRGAFLPTPGGPRIATFSPCSMK